MNRLLVAPGLGTPTVAAPQAETILRIAGMHCAACAWTVERALRGVAGVASAEIDSTTGWARVRWWPVQTTAAALQGVIERSGYSVVDTAAAAESSAGAALHARRRERRQALWRLFIAGFCMMQVMMYASPAYFTSPGEMPDDLQTLLRWASWLLTIPVMLFAAGPWLAGAWRDLRARRIGMDVPVALGILLAFAASTGATFAPGGVFGHEVWFDSLTMFVFFLLGARWLELRARHATVGALDALTRRIAPTAQRVRADGSAETVPVASLAVGERVRVLPGQGFVADGLIEPGGVTQVDEALLTGESLPVARAAGEVVLAGSVNLTSPVVLRITRLGEDTRYAQIVALVGRAALDRPRLVQAADRIARPFLLAVVVLAALAAAAWWFIDPTKSLPVAVAVLVVTCPCALSLASPSALLAATGALARRGVLVRRLGALEALAKADTFAFDKTGTLTEDRLELTRVERVERNDTGATAAWQEAVLALARASLHPVARALDKAWPGVQSAELQALVEQVGQGVEGIDHKGRCWRLGSASFGVHEAPAGAAAASGAGAGAGAGAGDGTDAVDSAGSAATRDPADDVGTQAVVSVDGHVLACLHFQEVLRPSAEATVAALHAEGVQTLLLSGDRLAAATRVAQAVGIEQVRAGATPEDKLAAVLALQQGGRHVAMVGDGINDAPVLAQADVSLAMGQGADLARAHADLTLLSGRLPDLLAARELARRTQGVIRQNLAWSAIYNTACVPLALVGWLPPWAAGLGMALSSLVVVLNAQRLRR